MSDVSECDTPATAAAKHALVHFGVDLDGDRIQYTNRLDGTLTKVVVLHHPESHPLVLFTDGRVIMEYIECTPDAAIMRFKALASNEIHPHLDHADVYAAIAKGEDVDGMLRCLKYIDKQPIEYGRTDYLSFDTKTSKFYIVSRQNVIIHPN
jgi:hypothetical protein